MLTTAAQRPRAVHLNGVPGEDTSALSFNQEQIWLDQQITPDTTAYNMPLLLHLKGRLDADVLERSLMEIVQRHDVLRAIFPTVGHRPVQVISGNVVVALPRVEVAEGSLADRLERVKLACEEELRRQFDLSRGPLLRSTLYRLSPTRHVLMLTVHHIVFDGWSTDILLQELAIIYAAFSAGRLSPLPDLPIRYSDFAQIQRQSLHREALDKLVSFWRAKLEGIPPLLALPFDHPVQSGRNYRGNRQSIVLGERLTTSLKDVGRHEGATPYMTLLAALAALLHRYTGQTDIVIGSPTAGRISVKTRSVLGAFINTLVLRTKLSGELTFAELIRRARRAALDAFSHQDLPYSTLVSELNPERDSSGSSLLQVMLVLHNTPPAGVEIPGLTIEDHRPACLRIVTSQAFPTAKCRT